MQKTYERIAEGLHKIGKIIKPSEIVMPIGFDGAILYHLLTKYYEKSGLNYRNNLENTVYISSQYNESDIQKFEKVLSSTNEKIYGLDMRTKTGTLGKMLKQMIQEWEDKTGSRADFSYTVIFNPNKYADLSAFEEELSDEERFYWLPRKEDLEKLFWQEDGLWKYNISHEFIANIPNVQQIKKLI